MLAGALLSVARMRAMCRHQAAGAALPAVLVTTRGSSFRPTRAISPTRTSRRESPNAAVGERWSLGRAFPGPTVYEMKFRVRGLTPSWRNFVLRCARSRSQIADR